MKPATTTTTATTSTTRTRPTRTASAKTDDVTATLATKLSISDPKGKQRSQPAEKTREERIADAMREVNTSSRGLSGLVEAGWKKSRYSVATTQRTSKSKEPDNSSQAISYTESAKRALGVLRELKPGDIDVERAASSLVGKIVSLEMHDIALEMLLETHGSLMNLYSDGVQTSPLTQTALLSLPLPSTTLESDTVLTLISNHLLYSIISFSYTTFSGLEPAQSLASLTTPPLAAYADALSETPTLLQWLPHLGRLPSKHTDSILTRAYTAITKASVLANSSPSDAKAMLRIRVYALHLLLHATPSIIKPSTFWDQTVKFTVAFIKDTASGSVSADVKNDATRMVLSVFSDILNIAIATRTKDDERAAWLSGSGFMGFCEYWMEFAIRGNDTALIKRISSFVRKPPPPPSATSFMTQASLVTDGSFARTSEPSHATPHPKQSSDNKAEAARVCTVLTEATSILEQLAALEEPDQEALGKAAETVDCTQPFLQRLYDTESSSGVDEQRYAEKIRRTFERLRRASVKALETLCTGSQVITRSFNTLIQTKVAHVDLLTPALDSLFALARTTLVPSSPLSYTQAYDYLARTIIVLASAETFSCDPAQLANYVRCLSGAFHNMGGTLYQASQYSHAVRFLEKSCSMGEKALKIYRAIDTSASQEKDKQDSWTQLAEQMYRRWEILGVCHSKTSDRRSAFESFGECVKAFSFATPSLFESASSHSASAVFDSNASLKHIASIIDRLTYTGVCDLLLHPRAVSLTSRLSQCYIPEGGQLEPAIARRVITGLILERQIDSLDACRWKEHGRQAIRSLLDEVLTVYTAQEMPIRRARVILKLLEYIHSSYDTAPDLTSSYEDLGREAELLLTQRNAGLDSGLVHFRSRYRAILKLRLALLVHREAQTSQFSKVVAYAEDACSVLKTALSSVPKEPAVPVHSPKAARTQPGRRAAGRGQTTTSRLPATKTRTRITRTAVAMPATPRKKRSRVSITPAIPPSINVGEAFPIFDDLPILINLLRSCAHLLGLLGQMVTKVHLLLVARRICEKFIDTRPDDYILASVELAQEYVNLGKLTKAGNIYLAATNLTKKMPLSEETRVMLSLRFAEAQAAAGNILKSSSAYCEAYSASEALPPIDKELPTAQRIAMRAIVLERAAVAASTFAMIQYSRDDPSAAINGLLQALRLWNRAVDTLSKIAPVSAPSEGAADLDNPFLAEPAPRTGKTTDNGKLANIASPSKTTPRLPALNGIEWRVAHGLLVTLFALTQAYVSRGSPREAEYFAQQAKEVAESLNTPAMVGRALARIGEIYLHLHQVEDSHASLAKAAEYLAGTVGPDAAEIRRLHAEHSRLHSDGTEAPQLYEEAMAMLEELDGVFAALDGQVASHRMSLGGPSPISSRISSKTEAIAPSVVMAILRQNSEEYASLLERFRSLSFTADAKAEENALLAKLSLENVYTRFQADMFLNSLSESIITLPMGMVSDRTVSSSSGQEVLAVLNHAEKLFWSDLALISRRGNVFDVRDAAVSLALICAFQTSLGGSTSNSPTVAARLLDVSSALTLQREVLEVVQHKFSELASQDDLQWPLMTSNGSVMPPPKRKSKTRFVSFESDDEDDGLQETTDSSLRKYWDSLASKYRNRVCDAGTLGTANIDGLPPKWTVVSISVTEDHDTMFVTRQRPGKEPLMFCIPLKERRENADEDDEFLGFEHAVHELNEIIRLSDEGTRQAQHIKNDRGARQAWWAQRTALDERMKDLLANIEFCWFGAFKTILNEPVKYPENLLNAFRTQIELAFKRSTPMKDKRQKSTLRLNDALLECFASLSPQCRDEELADLVYFILDLYQFHGTPIAAAEVDVDEVVVDLRAALEEHAARSKGKLHRQGDAHTFLVLDKNVAGIPWESLPVLRGRSVSRIPSVDFLLDRVQYCQMDAGAQEGQSVDRCTVDPRKTYYVLNPSGDLKNTEGRFVNWLQDMASVGWEGVVGRAPSEMQFSNALTRKDLVIYFGHGGAEQYIRSHKLRHLPRCAATMLWGCSSGALKEMGDFDRVGTPHNYMLSGCPTLVANLWDVTDRDIDKFSQAVFDKMHLTKNRVADWTPEPRLEETSIVAAVAQSRDVCKLKYLTGAAPVVYGIPFYL
ncbi:hypothetical protein PHLGIDRAFT_30059 [Phlebiopsis gigantea 11061_1 CR5-6]|uniref:separase n=1 Tax=Phlebiopsis gigantea (strain 11061_1 CR5-6) TaxID=745531 RepID=A0A0C3PLL0_PHLG1|nr:hypothetical protein PHLGIDRAFT_30059 [Phlebiopsis gigantea 11061_1 CR5-6]